MILAPLVVALPPIAQEATVREEQSSASFRERELELLSRIEELQRALREEQRSRLAQQEEWLAYMRVLRSFELPSLPDPPEFIEELLRVEPDPAELAAQRERERLAERGREICVQLGALLRADEIRHLDVLEVGIPSTAGKRPATGPVVARLLDARGRMVGMLKAERMWIEPSRSARSITLVFVDGYESRAGVVTPFVDGERRLFHGAIDPEPWIETLPELIDPASVVPVLDDGLWDVTAVRVRLERLLTEAASRGDARWRLAGLGGVRDGLLRDVQFVELNGASGSPRHVFADTAKIRPSSLGSGIEITLEGGNVRRGERVAPFLAGRYRIVLPFADVEAWRAARVPGLSAPAAPQLPPAESDSDVPSADTRS